MLSNTARADDEGTDWLGLGDALIDFFNWVLSKLAELGLAALDWLTTQVANLIPAGLQESINDAADYYATANTWLPLDYALDLMIAYIAIYLVVTTIKSIRK